MMNQSTSAKLTGDMKNKFTTSYFSNGTQQIVPHDGSINSMINEQVGEQAN